MSVEGTLKGAFMNYTELVKTNRSYRRYDEAAVIPETVVRSLVDLARICPSAANKQPLKYRIVTEPQERDLLFPNLAWAAYLSDWPGPSEGERPTGYILVCCDTEIAKEAALDAGIASQTILLGAADKGFGGCMFVSIKREAIKTAFKIPDRLDLLLVIALGKPVETVILEETGSDGSIRYYRDDDQRHHVPKRPLNEVLLD